MKVGDTLTAEVEDRNGKDVSDAVSFQWYADDKAIEGADEETLVVDDELLGAALKVVVTAENGNTFESAETEEVGVYDELEILSAEQKGEKAVKVTFSAPVGASDKITVKKAGNDVAVTSKLDDDKLGAELTFTDAITAGTYTVTLTPADTTVDPSSVTFEGQRAVLDRIEFLNDVLVMKDQYYNEGYAYVKGYDQFNHEKHMSGLNVVSGVGTFKSYDNETGKITIKDDTKEEKETGAFLTIKEVPVFVQYQEGTNVVSKNATLTVSTRAYLDSMEFGEIKKNSTDAAKRLTLNELRSNLWYVEINDAKDQYGNALSADDLQDQKDDNVLFVIPGDTGAFYKTGKFGLLNGKTVLWLAGDKDCKPGAMDLTITGAGGNTFKKEQVEILDNPYIDTLSVEYPDLYEGMTQSKKLNFSAIDQYGEDVNLWDFRPVAVGNKLTFRDVNGMTGVSTEVTVSGGPTFNFVEEDTKAKTFTVTINVNGAEAKSMAVFTTTTAGTKVATQTVMIGERGNASVIANTFPSVVTLDPGADWDINENIEFVDVNGNVMTRNKNNDLYPYFVDGDNIANSVVDKSLKGTDKPAKYLWTVSTKKIDNKAAAVAAMKAGEFDDDGVVDGYGIATDGSLILSKDYYVTVFGQLGTDYYILDSKSVRISNKAGDIFKVDTVAPGTLYATPTSGHSVGFKVKITNKVGESWTKDAASVSVGGIFTADGNKVLGGIAEADKLPDDTTATVPVSVYFDVDQDGKKDLVGTVNLTYSNVKPVATTTSFGYDVEKVGADGEELGRAGDKYSKSLTDTEFIAGENETYSIEDGKLTITNANKFGDTFTALVKDQYGQQMTNTVFYLDGKLLTALNTGDLVSAGRHVWEFKNDTQGQAFYMTSTGGSIVKVDSDIVGARVNNENDLTAAIGAAELDSENVHMITLGSNVETTEDLIIPANVVLTIPEGTELDTAGNDVTILAEEDDADPETIELAGEVVVDGTWYIGEGAEIENHGLVHGNGDVYVNGAEIKQDESGVFDLKGYTLHLTKATIGGGEFGGHIEIADQLVVSKDTEISGDVEVLSNTTNLYPDEGAELSLSGSINVPKSVTLFVGDKGSLVVGENAGVTVQPTGTLIIGSKVGLSVEEDGQLYVAPDGVLRITDNASVDIQDGAGVVVAEGAALNVASKAAVSVSGELACYGNFSVAGSASVELQNDAVLDLEGATVAEGTKVTVAEGAEATVYDQTGTEKQVDDTAENVVVTGGADDANLANVQELWKTISAVETESLGNMNADELAELEDIISEFETGYNALGADAKKEVTGYKAETLTALKEAIDEAQAALAKSGITYTISYGKSDVSTLNVPKEYVDKTGKDTTATVISWIVTNVNKGLAGSVYEDIDAKDVAIEGKTATVTLTIDKVAVEVQNFLDTYDTLLKKEAKDVVEGDATSINDALTAYGKLSTDAKNDQDIKSAKATLDTLKAAADQAKVNGEVENFLTTYNDILAKTPETVEIADKTTVATALTALGNLSAGAQADQEIVNAKSKLQSLSAKIAEIEEANALIALIEAIPNSAAINTYDENTTWATEIKKVTDVQDAMTAADAKTAVKDLVMADPAVQAYAGKTDTNKTWADLGTAVAASKKAIEDKKTAIENEALIKALSDAVKDIPSQTAIDAYTTETECTEALTKITAAENAMKAITDATVQTEALKDGEVKKYVGENKTWTELGTAVAASKTAIENKKTTIVDILTDAKTIQDALKAVEASGATFTVPDAYKAQVNKMANGSSASVPETNVTSSRWNYENGVFTVTNADNEETATAVWTITKNGYKATVTLTLTGTNGAETYTKTSVAVSEVSAVD